MTVAVDATCATLDRIATATATTTTTTGSPAAITTPTACTAPRAPCVVVWGRVPSAVGVARLRPRLAPAASVASVASVAPAAAAAAKATRAGSGKGGWRMGGRSSPPRPPPCRRLVPSPPRLCPLTDPAHASAAASPHRQRVAASQPPPEPDSKLEHAMDRATTEGCAGSNMTTSTRNPNTLTCVHARRPRPRCYVPRRHHVVAQPRRCHRRHRRIKPALPTRARRSKP